MDSKLYFIKTAEESKDGKLLVDKQERATLLLLVVSYADVYDNQKWNLAVRSEGWKISLCFWRYWL